MKDNTIKKLVFAALFAALSCAATMVIRIPTPIGGYIHGMACTFPARPRSNSSWRCWQDFCSIASS